MGTSWVARVARYFAWAVDGGLLGSRFNLMMLLESIPGLSEHSFKKVSFALNFMLHMRPRSMNKPWVELGVNQIVKEDNLSGI